MSYFILAALALIVGSLAVAAFFMLQRPSNSSLQADADTELDASNPNTQATPPSKGMARALALRVALSISLFLAILFAWQMGWISPTGVR